MLADYPWLQLVGLLLVPLAAKGVAVWKPWRTVGRRLRNG